MVYVEGIREYFRTFDLLITNQLLYQLSDAEAEIDALIAGILKAQQILA